MKPSYYVHLKTTAFFTLFAFLLHSGMVSYQMLEHANQFLWIIFGVGHSINLYNHVTNPNYGNSKRNNAFVTGLLQVTVALFSCLELNHPNHQFFTKVFLCIFVQLFMFTSIHVTHHAHGRTITVDIIEIK